MCWPKHGLCVRSQLSSLEEPSRFTSVRAPWNLHTCIQVCVREAAVELFLWRFNIGGLENSIVLCIFSVSYLVWCLKTQALESVIWVGILDSSLCSYVTLSVSALASWNSLHEVLSLCVWVRLHMHSWHLFPSCVLSARSTKMIWWWWLRTNIPRPVTIGWSYRGPPFPVWRLWLVNTLNFSNICTPWGKRWLQILLDPANWASDWVTTPFPAWGKPWVPSGLVPVISMDLRVR